jgi:hypothetical protein
MRVFLFDGRQTPIDIGRWAMSLEQNRLHSRRSAVTRLGLSGITAVVAARTVGLVAAQDASSTPKDPPPLVKWAAAWSSGNPAHRAFFGEDLA